MLIVRKPNTERQDQGCVEEILIWKPYGHEGDKGSQTRSYHDNPGKKNGALTRTRV